VVGAILLATGVIDTGKTTKVIRQEAITSPAASTKSGGRTVADIYKTEGQGVVFIQARGVTDTQSPFGLPQQGTATGSGFVVGKDGYILTNAHVVEGASQVTVSFEDKKTADAKVVGRDTSTDIAVLKVQPLGGVRACLRIAEDIGMPVVVSSALETSLGLAAGVALAAALPALDHACGLATRALLTADVAAPELVPVDGFVSVVAPTVVPALVDAVSAAPDRVAWWADRLAAVRAVRQDRRS